MNAQRIVKYILGSFLCVSALIFSLWKCRYGVELYDEPFFILPGFKLLNLGHGAIVDEIHNALRQHDLLNHILIRPWLPFNILALRQASVFVYWALLVGLSVICFGKNFGLCAALVVFIFSTYDVDLNPTWSHN